MGCHLLLRGPSRPRDPVHVWCVSCGADGLFTAGRPGASVCAAPLACPLTLSALDVEQLLSALLLLRLCSSLDLELLLSSMPLTSGEGFSPRPLLQVAKKIQHATAKSLQATAKRC